jgi:hypothetical protein
VKFKDRFSFSFEEKNQCNGTCSLRSYGRSIECGVSGTFRQVKRYSVTLARTSHASTHGSCCFDFIFMSAASTVRQRFRCAPCCHALCLCCASPHGSYLHPGQELHFVTWTKDKAVFLRSALAQSARCPCCARLRPLSDTPGRPAGLLPGGFVRTRSAGSRLTMEDSCN